MPTCSYSLKAAKVYAEAVKTVEAKQATGKLHTLWVSYARLYERHGDLNTARMIFKKATQVCKALSLDSRARLLH